MARSRNAKAERTRYPGIWRKPSGRYEARWTLNGKKYGKTFDTLGEAQSYRAQMGEAKRQRTVVDPTRSKMTVGEWAPRWVASKRNLKPSTLHRYESIVRARILPIFGDRALGSLDRLDVEEWVTEMIASELATSTIRQSYVVLSQMLGYAVRNHYLSYNPASDIDLPRLKKSSRNFLTADEVRALAEATREEYRAMVYVLAYGGLRFGEAAALRRRDCDLLRRRLNVARSATTIGGHIIFGDPKSYAIRSVSLPRFAAEELARHLESVPLDPDALVFTAPQGGFLHYNNYRRNIWNPARAAANLPDVTPHELRHTCASLLIAIGEHPKSVSAQLGHASVSFTLDTYGHLFDGHMDESMDALDRQHRETPDSVRRIG